MMIGIEKKCKPAGSLADFTRTPEGLAAELTAAGSVEFVTRDYKIWEAVPGRVSNNPSDIPYLSERETVLTLSHYPYEVRITRQGQICPLLEENIPGIAAMIGGWHTDSFNADRSPDAIRVTLPKAPDMQALVRDWTPEERGKFHDLMEAYDNTAAPYMSPSFDYPSGFPFIVGVDDDFDANDFGDVENEVAP